MKKLILLITLFTFLLTACSRPETKEPVSSISADTQAQPRQRSITVNGNAEVRVVPDEVVLLIGIETSDLDMEIAKRKNDEIVRKVMSITTELGIEPKHVQTDYLSIDPRYDSYYDKQNFVGYFVFQNIAITLKDVSKYEQLLSSLLAGGVNYIQNIQFRTTELRKYRDEARKLAIQAAREKAEALAGELGQEIGAPLSIQEQATYDAGWYRPWWGYSWGGAAQNVVQNAGPEAGSVDGTIALGQIPVNATVTVEFELK